MASPTAKLPVSKPQPAIAAVTSLWELPGIALISPQPWTMKARGRLALIAGSSWRNEPAAALRGLAKILAPASDCRAFSAAKPAFEM